MLTFLFMVAAVAILAIILIVSRLFTSGKWIILAVSALSLLIWRLSLAFLAGWQAIIVVITYLIAVTILFSTSIRMTDSKNRQQLKLSSSFEIVEIKREQKDATVLGQANENTDDHLQPINFDHDDFSIDVIKEREFPQRFLEDVHNNENSTNHELANTSTPLNELDEIIFDDPPELLPKKE